MKTCGPLKPDREDKKTMAAIGDCSGHSAQNPPGTCTRRKEQDLEEAASRGISKEKRERKR